MGFLDWFRRKPPIAARETLADFVDRQAAFLAQKGVFEYSRARAGPHGNVIFRERAFLDELERARWRAFPLCLGMVGEVVEGALRPHAGADATAMRDTLSDLVAGVRDRYPQPPSLSAEEWQASRAGIVQAIAAAGLHPVKPVMEVPAPFVERYVALMPIHEKLRGRDLPTLRNYLVATLCNIHDELTRRADLSALAAELLSKRA